MKNGKNWAIADAIIGTIGAIAGIAGIFTGIKAAKYNDERHYAEFEERYGLIPCKSEEVKEDE